MRTHTSPRGGGQEPVELALLEELVLDCTLVVPELVVSELEDELESVELVVPELVVPELVELELAAVVELAVVAFVASTTPSVPALRMPRALRMAVKRRALTRPA